MNILILPFPIPQNTKMALQDLSHTALLLLLALSIPVFVPTTMGNQACVTNNIQYAHLNKVKS